jgi:SAM-dependent methyltransferase
MTQFKKPFMDNATTHVDVCVNCTVCHSPDLAPCVELPNVPVYCSVGCATREEALNVARGDIKLAFCRNCGHVFNAAFDPRLVDYAVDYQNSLHASARFQRYAREIVDHLIERYVLRGKQVLEIGAGQGEFLALLVAAGDNHGVGIDPCYVPAHAEDPRLEFIKDYYSSKYARQEIDLICCRHTLEHIAQPRAWLDDIRDTIGDGFDPAVFFEVPNVLYTLRDMGIWDIIYEHCSYFSPSSLRRIFQECRFQTRDLNVVYDGQFLAIEAAASSRPSTARPVTPSEKDEALEALSDLVAAFGQRYRTKVDGWQRNLAEMVAAGRRVAVWGSGAKGVTFLNTADAGKAVDCVVDINPRKQGAFIPGTAQKITAPGELPARAIDTILVMNPAYRNEIEAEVRALGLSAQVQCV